jgi:hypothetical protein
MVMRMILTEILVFDIFFFISKIKGNTSVNIRKPALNGVRRYRYCILALAFVWCLFNWGFHENHFFLSTKSKFCLNLDFDIGISILISTSESNFQFRHRNSDFCT